MKGKKDDFEALYKKIHNIKCIYTIRYIYIYRYTYDIYIDT